MSSNEPFKLRQFDLVQLSLRQTRGEGKIVEALEDALRVDRSCIGVYRICINLPPKCHALTSVVTEQAGTDPKALFVEGKSLPVRHSIFCQKPLKGG